MPPSVFFPLYPDWQACITAFLAHVKNRSGSMHTVIGYSALLRQFFSDCRKAPEDYTRADVESFLNLPTSAKWRHGTPPSANTRHARLVALASFYRFAGTWAIVRDGRRVALLTVPAPTAGIVFGKRSGRHSALTSDELTRLVASIPDDVQGLRDRAILLLFFWTARRKAELARLTWGDIEYGIVLDHEGRTRPGWLYRFRGKGQGENWDSAELPLPAKQALDRYLAASGRFPLAPSDPLFVPFRSNKPLDLPLSPGGMTYVLKTRLTQAGLDPSRFSLHSLRHTSLREHYAVKPDPRAIQRLARHSNLAITDTYLGELFGTADPMVEALTARYGKL